MEAAQRYITQTLPKYLRSLPIPKDADGFSKLSQDDWLKLVPFTAVVLTIVVIILTSLFTDPTKKWKDEVKRLKKELENAHVNRSVSKDEAKVVNTIPFCDIEQCEQKTMCRCWKSSKFPYCDGTHNKHNQATGDNVGPLIIKGGKQE